MHPTSLHPYYGFDAGAMCLLSFIHQVGCHHLTSDLLQVRTGTPAPARKNGDKRQHQALAPRKAQALSGNLWTSFFRFHLIPCLSAISDEITAGHYRNQLGFVIQL